MECEESGALGECCYRSKPIIVLSVTVEVISVQRTNFNAEETS